MYLCVDRARGAGDVTVGFGLFRAQKATVKRSRPTERRRRMMNTAGSRRCPNKTSPGVKRKMSFPISSSADIPRPNVPRSLSVPIADGTRFAIPSALPRGMSPGSSLQTFGRPARRPSLLGAGVRARPTNCDRRHRPRRRPLRVLGYGFVGGGR